MPDQHALAQGAEAVSLFCRLHVNARKDLPIRSSEMGLLILVVKGEAAVTPVMAADFFKVKKPMITAMVRSLASKGYLSKVPSLADKRSYALAPTARAAELVEQAYGEYFKTMELLQARLGSEDYGALIGLLGRANSILLEERENG